MEGQVFEGQVFGPGVDFGGGNVFIGCTFYATCNFGEGCVFKDCTFMRCCYPYYTNTWSQVQSSAVLEGCTLDYVVIQKDATLAECIEQSCTIIDPTCKDCQTHEILGTGGEHVAHAEGQIVTGDERWAFDCKEWKEEVNCGEGKVLNKEGVGSCSAEVKVSKD